MGHRPETNSSLSWFVTPLEAAQRLNYCNFLSFLTFASPFGSLTPWGPIYGSKILFAVTKSKLQNPPMQATPVDLRVHGAQSVGAYFPGMPLLLTGDLVEGMMKGRSGVTLPMLCFC